MKTFTKLYTALNITENGEKTIRIQKVRKDWTKREFFKVEDMNGNNLARVMFSRLYDAKSYAMKI